jgi:hypothetical protein
MTERHDRSAPTSGFHGRIAERMDELGPREHRLHHFTLNADASSMNDPQRRQSKFVRFFEVSFDGSFRVAGRDGMEVENVRDRDSDGFIHTRINQGLKTKGPIWRVPDRAQTATAAHPRLGDANPGTARNRFHLIFQPEFQFLEPVLFNLLLRR